MITSRIEIKVNRNLYKNILILFFIVIGFVESLAYFLGFDINAKSILYYVIFLISTMLLFFALFLIIDKLNKKYIVFDGEKIIEKHNNEEKVFLYYDQILGTKYHNNIDLVFGIIDFGYVEIKYKINSKDKDLKHLCIYMSKKMYIKIFQNEKIKINSN